MKKKINPTVRFSGTTMSGSDHHGIMKTDGKRPTKIPSDRKFMSSRVWILSTVVLLIAIIALTYRGYLDTRAVNYPFQGPKVRTLHKSNNLISIFTNVIYFNLNYATFEIH